MCPIWRVLVMEDVLGFCALVLTILMSLAIAVWFCCSIVESIVKMRRRHKKLRYKALLRDNKRLKSRLVEAVEEHVRLRKRFRYKALLRENERLKSLLAEAAEENVHLKRYHAEIIRRKINGVSGTLRNGTRRHARELPPGGI
jgi:Na+-transporting methylmalonyl-CoA/oxaloacetate decarboxylase gamma subunit